MDSVGNPSGHASSFHEVVEAVDVKEVTGDTAQWASFPLLSPTWGVGTYFMDTLAAEYVLVRAGEKERFEVCLQADRPFFFSITFSDNAVQTGGAHALITRRLICH